MNSGHRINPDFSKKKPLSQTDFTSQKITYWFNKLDPHGFRNTEQLIKHIKLKITGGKEERAGKRH